MAGRKDFHVPSTRFCVLETWPTVKMCPLVIIRSDHWMLRSKWDINTAPPKLRKHQGRRDRKTVRTGRKGHVECRLPGRMWTLQFWIHSLSNYLPKICTRLGPSSLSFTRAGHLRSHTSTSKCLTAIQCYIGTSIPKTMGGTSHSNHHS